MGGQRGQRENGRWACTGGVDCAAVWEGAVAARDTEAATARDASRRPIPSPTSIRSSSRTTDAPRCIPDGDVGTVKETDAASRLNLSSNGSKPSFPSCWPTRKAMLACARCGAASGQYSSKLSSGRWPSRDWGGT
ncbi:Os12g0539025 [Oryza sativa Japonica Group]|uniref:Os12g0539025 protein n=1 Tax=Oryza sativa subsp. japonica TaxID=39947 RepID=A0A0N7KU56_ORYSJ|nr:Os12g0539025 [Oryza sativa Japonica Group]